MPRPAIDAEIALFASSLREAWASHPSLSELPPRQARKVAERVREPWTRGGPAMQRTEDFNVAAGCSALRVRLLDPGVGRPAPALVYLHGGGFTLFSIDTHDRLMREYAAAANLVVLGVDYPLAPEAKYPVALDALVLLSDWLMANAHRVGVDPARVAIGGDSAGANLALATCLRLRDRDGSALYRAMLLNYGCFTHVCSDEAEAVHGGPGAVLDRAEIEYYFANYLYGPDELDNPYACPMSAVLEGLPPAFITIPECDILAEQNVAMVERMEAAGIDITAKRYAGATHSFLEAMSIARVARQAIRDGAAWLRRKIALR